MQIGWFRGKKNKQTKKKKAKKKQKTKNFTYISTTTAELFFSANKKILINFKLRLLNSDLYLSFVTLLYCT